MKRYRKAALAFLCTLLLALSVGCSSGLSRGQVLSARYRANGKVISVGDSRESVEQVVGKDVYMEGFFEEDNVWRISYWDAEGLSIDYMEDRVVALRLTENTRWEIAGGARIGMTREKIDELYKDYKFKEPGASGGILFAYDKELNPVEFSEDAPYIVTISFEEDLAAYISIQDNF